MPQHNILITLLLATLVLAMFHSSSCDSTINIFLLKNNDTVIGVKSHLTMFIYRQLAGFNTSTEDIFSRWKHQSMPFLTIGVQNQYFSLFSKLLDYHNITQNEQFSIHTIHPSLLTCRGENIFDTYDAILMDTYDFTYYVRGYREAQIRKSNTTLNGFINSFDFFPFPLIPSEIYVKDRSNVEDMFAFSPMTCSNSFLADAEMLRMMNGYANFSMKDVETNENVTSLILRQDHSYYTEHYQEFMKNHTELQTIVWPVDKVLSNMLPSSCHYCTTTLCELEGFVEADYFMMGIGVVTVIYFVLLFTTQSFKKPAIKRRMFVPYIPLLSFIMFLLFTFGIVQRCFYAVRYVSMVICLWWILIYGFTLIRFVYLRNLYQIISTSSHKKILKMLASSWFGFAFTGIGSLLVSLIVTSEGAYFFMLDNESDALIYGAVNIMAFAIVACSVALLAMGWDLFMNRKKIKTKGVQTYLLFDDPFYIRVDLLSLVFTFVASVVVLIGLTVFTADFTKTILGGFLNLTCSISIIMFCGGTAMAIELFKKIKYRNTTKKESSDMEQLLVTNEALHSLFTEYSKNEHSLENIKCFDTLREYSNDFKKLDKIIPTEKLIWFEQEFIKQFSNYELNISGQTKRKFYELIDCQMQESKSVSVLSSVESQEGSRSSSNVDILTMKSGITAGQLKEVLSFELLLNMNDTFGRLQRSEPYREWEAIYLLQQHSLENHH